MKQRMIMLLAAILACAGNALAQGAAGDLLAGKLVDPKVGQWAWYDLVDKSTKASFSIRQAVVGEEKVGSKTGYWVEIEVVPRAGFKEIFKVLLVGPASDPRNILKAIHKSGKDPAEAVEVPQDAKADDSDLGKRKSLGKETVTTASGPIQAEHVSFQSGDRTIEMWVSDEVKPSGVIKIVSPEGEMVLRSRGQGGADGKSVLTEKVETKRRAPGKSGRSDEPGIRVETKTGDGEKK